ncbi:MAG: hypothetical protein R3C11_26565 [Planctomycetaceae bacterium]
MSPYPALSLIPTGNPKHIRFVISKLPRLYWTGADWSPQLKDALLFDDEQVAGKAAFEVLSQSSEASRKFRFVAPIEVEVRSDEAPDLLHLQVWLMKASRLYVDYNQAGLPNATALLSIDWTEMKGVDG